MRYNQLSNLVLPPKAYVSERMSRVGIEFVTTQEVYIEASTVFYDWGYVDDMNIHPKIDAITGIAAAEVILGERFLLLHVFPNPSTNMPHRELIFRFKEDTMLEVSDKNLTAAQGAFYSRSVVKENKDGTIGVFRQYESIFDWDQLNVKVTKELISKQAKATPALESIVMDQDIVGGDADGIMSPRHGLRWMYITYPTDLKTEIHAVKYDHTVASNNVVVPATYNLTG